MNPFTHRTEQYSGNGDVDCILFVILKLGEQYLQISRFVPSPNRNFHTFERSEEIIGELKESDYKKATSVKLRKYTNK
jgi:hypothetical protein